MADDTISLTGDRLAHVVCAFQQLQSLQEQFIALGMLAELVMKNWPPHVSMAMLASLELRLGLSDEQPPQNVMPN